eukprot:scaffold27594_cov48-Attheya_sp.AAC.8
MERALVGTNDTHLGRTGSSRTIGKGRIWRSELCTRQTQERGPRHECGGRKRLITTRLVILHIALSFAPQGHVVAAEVIAQSQDSF